MVEEWGGRGILGGREWGDNYKDNALTDSAYVEPQNSPLFFTRREEILFLPGMDEKRGSVL